MSPSRGRLLFFAIPCIVTSGVIGLRLAMASHGFPVADGDAAAFLPNTLRFAHGNGLTNTFWQRAIDLDPSGQGRLLWHGFLYPRLVAALMSAPSASALAWAQGLLDAVVIALVVAALFLWRRPLSNATAADGVVIAAGAVAMTTVVLGFCGRPEPLVCAVIAVGACAAVAWADARGAVAAGVTLGTVAVTSPVLAVVVAGLAVAARMALAASAFRDMAVLAISALATMAAAVAWGCPGTPFEWIAGLRAHARIALEPTTGGRFAGAVHYLVLNPSAPMIGAIFLVLIAGLLARAFALDRRRVLVLATSAASVAALLWLLARRPEQVYYLAGLLPLAIMAALDLARRSRLARALVLTAMGPVAAGIALPAAQFHDSLRRGVSLETAHSHLEALRRSHDGAVLGSSALWVLAPDMRRVDDATTVADRMGPRDLLVVQQANSGRQAPPVIDGLRLVADFFVPGAPAIAGVPIGRATKSYAFAAYVTD